MGWAHPALKPPVPAPVPRPTSGVEGASRSQHRKREVRGAVAPGDIGVSSSDPKPDTVGAGCTRVTAPGPWCKLHCPVVWFTSHRFKAKIYQEFQGSHHRAFDLSARAFWGQCPLHDPGHTANRLACVVRCTKA